MPKWPCSCKGSPLTPAPTRLSSSRTLRPQAVSAPPKPAGFARGGGSAAGPAARPPQTVPLHPARPNHSITENPMEKPKKRRWPWLVAAAAAALLLPVLDYWNLLPHKTYTAEHFGIETLQSPLDADGDGIDDYTDILLGARQDAENHPKYDPSYFAGGYPPENRGVCTDVVWRALQNAGYDLKAMIDADIARNTALYPRVQGTPDPNIDFRRVPNLRVFFDRHAECLTLDPEDIAAWQPGDIVTFGSRHVGIISDKRNRDGIPYLIHNSGQPRREEDALLRCHRNHPISGHYRWQGGTAG